MKFQWSIILALLFALIVAIFAVVNVDPVQVNYIFGTARWPLILVILGSALMGGIIIGSVGLFRIYVVQRKVKALQKENNQLKEQVMEYEKKEQNDHSLAVVHEMESQTESEEIKD